MNADRLDELRTAISPLRQKLLTHPLYENIHSLEAIQTFMKFHVFAVWDFMSLLKSLQQDFCCNTVPWMPPKSGTFARFINEIVLEEESDEDHGLGFISHFELYLRAMESCGAETKTIERFLEDLRGGFTLEDALANGEIPEAARQFSKQTFRTVEAGGTYVKAAAFTFGREDLLPDVFGQIVQQVNAHSEGRLDEFVYYLNRHIELDGDSHGPIATNMVKELCGESDEKWRLAQESAEASLSARCLLFDGILEAIRKQPVA